MHCHLICHDDSRLTLFSYLSEYVFMYIDLCMFGYRFMFYVLSISYYHYFFEICFGHIVLNALIKYCIHFLFLYIFTFLQCIFSLFYLLCVIPLFLFMICCLFVMMFHGSFVLVLFPCIFHDSNKC